MVPPLIVTVIGCFVLCCVIAIPAPVVVDPFPLDATSNFSAVAIIVPPLTVNFPALISIPEIPLIVPPVMVVSPSICGA